MGSKAVATRAKSARAVIQAAETHGKEISKGIAALLTPHVGKGDVPDTLAFTKQCVAALLHTTEFMEAAASAHEAELADDHGPRSDRDRFYDELRAEVVRGRGGVEGVYGAPALRLLGFVGAVPTDPAALVAYTKTACKGLRDKSAKLPPPLQASMSIDRALLATSLSDKATKLEAALKDVAREGREAESTQKEKNRAIAAYDNMFARVAGFITALFELAGEPELAERVRPSTRRPGTTAADEDGPDDEEETPGGGGGGGPA